MKKLITLTLALAMCLCMFSFVGLAEENIKIVINGEEVSSDVAPVMLNDRVMVPIRVISETLNCDVAWDETTEGVIIYRNNHLYMTWLNKDYAFDIDGNALGNYYKMDVPPYETNGRTLVPIRAISELLGAQVDWIEETQTVEVKYEIGITEDNEGVAAECMSFEQVFNGVYDYYVAFVEGNAAKITGKIVMEDDREIKFELYPEFAPYTVSNFITLAEEKFYDNTLFHRVIDGFVAQGGGYNTAMEHKEANTVPGEFLANGFLNLIPHDRAALSLARAVDYNSGSSEFFICHADAPHLDGMYAAFGKVTEGMEIVDEICKSETDENDAPVENIIVKTIVIDKNE